MAIDSTSSPSMGNFAPLLVGKHRKTLDVGSNGYTASSGPAGDILQLTAFHPKHGIVVVSPYAQFDGSRYWEPEYVRDYRKRMLHYIDTGKKGFGVRVEGDMQDLQAGFVENRWLRTSYTPKPGVSVTTTLAVGDSGETTQTTTLSSTSDSLVAVDYTFNLDVSVNRASYGQLTEGGPIPLPDSENVLTLLDAGKSYAITNPHLDAMLEGSLTFDGEPVSLEGRLYPGSVENKTMDASITERLKLQPGSSITLVACFGLHPGTTPASTPPRSGVVSGSSIAASSSSTGDWKLAKDEEGAFIIMRNLEYILGNCTVPVSPEVVCFITDHVALPLGWNRDNYWQIRFLLDVYTNASHLMYPKTLRYYTTRIHTSVRGHLNWVFRTAQRPHGYWHRSYLTTGVPKDGPVFQQDQQCYPLLEICDYFEIFASEGKGEADFVRGILEEQAIPDVLAILEGRRDPETGLFKTEETPGDDEVEHPYHFSSHVLLWHTVTRLASLVKKLAPSNQRLSAKALDRLAAEIHEQTIRHFVAKNPEYNNETMFAYLTDGVDQHNFYHDANDIPTLFALDWGFLNSSPASTAASPAASTPSSTQSSPTLPPASLVSTKPSPFLRGAWEATLHFALSPLNPGGYYPAGPFGGLGSVHTRAPWPLGYAQEFVFADITGNEKAREDAWRRIKGSVLWDGLFSEAVDGETGACVSKAWFSWPGAMIGSALIQRWVKKGVI